MNEHSMSISTNWKAIFRLKVPRLYVGRLGVFFLLFCVTRSFAQFEQDDNRILNQFIVMLKPSQTIERLLLQFPSVKNKECLSQRMNIYLLERNTTSAPDEFLLTLKQNQLIKLAQFNHRNIKQRSLIPNDPDFGLQWNMLNTGLNGSLAGADIEATEAWAINHNNVTVEGDTIVIAVIDDTFDLGHEDLNYFVNQGEIPGNGVDDDGNGYIDDVSGWNIFTHNGDVGGTGGGSAHSTHCAGIAAAIGNNGKGVAGVCWGAKILPVAGSSETESQVVAAYAYVLNMRVIYNNTFGTKGAFVVSTNSSFGVDNGNPADYPIWCAMYDTMGFAGILSAAATANKDLNVDTQHDMPTECPSNWLISVTNTLSNDVKNGVAAYGKNSIDLGAPGTGIHSTIPPSSYGNMNGTSMASPHLAGTVAAMYAAACKSFIDRYYEQPDSIALLVKKYILDAAEWNSSLNNITVSNGRLNLLRAITNLRKYDCDSCGFNVDITKNPIVCKNDSSGQAALTFSTGTSSDYNIVWSNGLNFPTLQNLTPGFYVATVTDTLTGCARVATVEFHDPDTITITSVTTIPSVGGNPGNIIVNAKAGNESLLYSIDGVTYQQTSTLAVPSNGNYTVYVKNSLGCVVLQSVTVAGVHELAIDNWQLAVYPNPVEDLLTVSCSQFATEKGLLQIFDLAGRKIFESVPPSVSYQLSTAPWSNGIYFLTVESNNQKLTRRFVVNK